jgi:acetyltransferase-like isoleucine patch superfamily enzyme
MNFCVKLAHLLPYSLAFHLLELVRNTPTMIGLGLRYILAKRLCKRCGRFVTVAPGCYLLNIDKLELGDFVDIHPMCYLECAGGLRIGSYVALAHSVSIITHEHDYLQKTVPIREAPVILKPVVIGDNVWIGAGSRVLAGVTIGTGSVVGAGAVVTKPIPDNVVAAGVPAKILSER